MTYERIRKIYFNVPTAENTIVVRKTNYLGKLSGGQPTTHPDKY